MSPSAVQRRVPSHMPAPVSPTHAVSRPSSRAGGGHSHTPSVGMHWATAAEVPGGTTSSQLYPRGHSLPSMVQGEPQKLPSSPKERQYSSPLDSAARQSSCSLHGRHSRWCHGRQRKGVSGPARSIWAQRQPGGQESMHWEAQVLPSQDSTHQPEWQSSCCSQGHEAPYGRPSQSPLPTGGPPLSGRPAGVSISGAPSPFIASDATSTGPAAPGPPPGSVGSKGASTSPATSSS